jgi:O-antigen ligase
MFLPSVAVLVAWGALAFGAEYSWAYAPLLTFALTASVLGMYASPARSFPSKAVLWALAAWLACVVVQVLPLPSAVVTRLSPSRTIVDFDRLFAQATMAVPTSHAVRTLSVAPAHELLGVLFLAVLGVLFFGCVRGFSTSPIVPFARAIVVLGVVVALVEMAQRSSGSEIVYGLWYPPKLNGHFSAPFINRNHTAGWLLMAMSVSAGYLVGLVSQGWRRVEPTWRARVVWLASAAAGEALMVGAAVTAMAVAVVFTTSRSGLIGLAAMILLLTGAVIVQQPSGSRRSLVLGCLALVLIAGAALGRLDVVMARFDSALADGRFQVWNDTLRIVHDFPLTGTGWNTYGIAMLHYQTVPDGGRYIEAHNDYLQLVAEGGALLVLPVLLSMALLVREIRRRFSESRDDVTRQWVRIGAVVGLIAIALQEMTDFTLQMPGAAVLFVVLLAIAIHKRDHAPRRSSAAIDVG